MKLNARYSKHFTAVCETFIAVEPLSRDIIQNRVKQYKNLSLYVWPSPGHIQIFPLRMARIDLNMWRQIWVLC